MRSGILTVVLAAAVAAAAQSAPAPVGAPTANPGQAKVYTNSDLHLTFSYPAELEPRDPKEAAALGRRMVYGENALPSAATEGRAGRSGQGSAALPSCTKTLLALGTATGSGSRSGGNSGAGARLTLFDVDLNCLPRKAAKSRSVMNTTLQGFAVQAVTLLGMVSVSDPAAYEIEGHRAYFAASQGTPVAQTDVQPDQGEGMAAVTVGVNGHVLAWVLESSDLDLLNRMLASPVDFGMGKPQPLFPAGVQGEDGLALAR